MDILIYHTTILDLLRKERLDIPTNEVIDKFTHLAQLSYFEKCFGCYGTGQKEDDLLAPFKVDGSFTSDAAGFVSFSNDYAHLLGLSTITYDNARQISTRRKVQLLQEDKLSEALSNQVRVVSAEWPVGQSLSGGVQLYPRTQLSGVMTYLKMPVAPKLAYTVSGRTMTYDPAGSTQLLWTEEGVKCVMIGTLAYLVLNLNDPSVIQFSQLEKQEAKGGY